MKTDIQGLKQQHSETVYKHYFPEWQGKNKNINCFAHDDEKPSLSIYRKDGEYKHHCHACSISGDCLDIINQKENITDIRRQIGRLKEIAGITEPKKRIVEIYDYTDEQGNLLFQTVRYEPKDFKQRRPDGKGGWIYSLKDVCLVPYNLPEVLKAKSIIIVEGEKDCDKLKALGFTSTTCNPMGAGKWKPGFSQYFKAKRIVIIPDNDKPGRDHAQAVAKNLKNVAESVRIIELPDLPEKNDVSDWISQGHTKEELIEIIRSTPEWIPETKRYFVRIGDILGESIEPPNEIIKGFIPEGSLNLLSAPSTYYKTWIALYAARCVAEGIPFLGRDTQTRKVYYIDKENPRSVLVVYSQKLGINEHTPIYLWPLWSEKEPPTFPDDIYLEIAKERPLIIFDSQIRFYPKGTDENSASDMNPFMGFLRNLTKAGATVLILHHAGKSESSDYRGSSDILGGVDIAYTIKKSDDDPAVLTLKCIKSRFYQEKDITIEIISDDTSLSFEIAPDPDTEDLKALHNLITEIKDSIKELPNQSKVVDKASKEFGFKRQKTLKLLRKGEGKLWYSEQIKERNNAKVYDPVPVVRLSNTIYTRTSGQVLEKADQLSNNAHPLSIPETLDNTELSSCQKDIQTTETTDVIEVLEVLE